MSQKAKFGQERNEGKTNDAKEKFIRHRKQSRESEKKEILKDMLELPALLRILMEKKKRVNLKGHKKALELAMSLCFCSPAACRLLRKSGFLLPAPCT